MSTILVTGGSGFISSHCILKLLAAGHTVRTTVRSLERETGVRAMLKAAGAQPDQPLSFVAADLGADAGWAQAVRGCDYVLHVASPFPAGVPKHDDELVVPAREGTLRVLRAARDAAVRRVVLTSSFAAIGYGRPPQSRPFDETSWSDLTGRVSAYVKSKTLAERAAWNFVGESRSGPELAVINPVAVLGPVLGSDLSTSIKLIKRMLEGAMPGYPALYFGVVDVRDVADLHLMAMTQAAARGERFLAAAGDFMSLLDIATVLRNRLGVAAKRVPTRQVPGWILRVMALASPIVREILPEVGKKKNGTHEKARRLLGWAPRSNEESIVSSAESLLDLGLVKGNSPRGTAPRGAP
jgi:nucleoside-diphosphate-sugar epimerase